MIEAHEIKKITETSEKKYFKKLMKYFEYFFFLSFCCIHFNLISFLSLIPAQDSHKLLNHI